MKKNKTIWQWIYHFLLYLTNNLPISKHEIQWDIFFWCVNTLALITGIVVLTLKSQPEWIFFLIIEYCWAWDSLKVNRK